jgi:phosphoribosylanthranilate isomerase
VQLHGDEDEGYIARLRHRFDGPIIRATPVIDRPPGPVSQLADYPLFDTGGSQRGGSGTAFDWTLLKGVSGPFFLAGGLHQQNVTEAIRLLRPFCVDVSSGVETGVMKNPDKISQFIETARRVRE